MQPNMLNLDLRRRCHMPGSDSTVTASPLTISASAVALIVCDIWDHHWCRGASARVEEMVSTVDRLVGHLRNAGALIIHAPSETMPFYEGSPARETAIAAPHVQAPCDLSRWRSHDAEVEGPFPINDRDCCCDDLPICPIPERMPWTRQHAAIHISDADAVTDSGQEVHNLLELRGIEFVLITGVHTNMCVLGRPFGIRRLVQAGRSVALVRDLTDAMYCSRQPPFVSHSVGTQLVIEHIERYWCSTITSDQILGGEPFEFKSEP